MCVVSVCVCVCARMCMYVSICEQICKNRLLPVIHVIDFFAKINSKLTWSIINCYPLPTSWLKKTVIMHALVLLYIAFTCSFTHYSHH